MKKNALVPSALDILPPTFLSFHPSPRLSLWIVGEENRCMSALPELGALPRLPPPRSKGEAGGARVRARTLQLLQSARRDRKSVV